MQKLGFGRCRHSRSREISLYPVLRKSDASSGSNRNADQRAAEGAVRRSRVSSRRKRLLSGRRAGLSGKPSNRSRGARSDVRADDKGGTPHPSPLLKGQSTRAGQNPHLLAVLDDYGLEKCALG
jgi:hypothetical protein